MTAKARCYDHRDTVKMPPLCATCVRIAIERRIVKRVVDVLLAAGLGLQTDQAGDELVPSEPTYDRAVIIRELRETDDEHLFATWPDGRRSWVYFVYGNDGWDVISDYTTSLEAVLKPVNDYACTLSN